MFGLTKFQWYFFAVILIGGVLWFVTPKASRPVLLPSFHQKAAGPVLKRDVLLSAYNHEQITMDSRTSTFYEKLLQAGLTGTEIATLVESAKPAMDFRRVQRGFKFEILYGNEIRPELVAPGDSSAGVTPPKREFLGLFVPVTAIKSLFITKNGQGTYDIKTVEEDVERKLQVFAGHVDDSLWASATDAEMSPTLVADLTEIFAWQVDFARAVREGDKWRILVDQGYVGGQPLNDSRILAAEYVNEGDVYQAVYFQRGETRGYYFPDGTNMRRLFLKSPLKFGRITSGFNLARFHPLLKIRRPHLGIDYGAPVGTPIRAVGDGTILVAQMRGGAGNMISLRHNAVYMTNYKHLSRFGPGIRAGKRVRQGDLIGYTGTTGLSTGPHLHFEMWQNGRYVDPLKVKFPSASPLPATNLAEFKQIAEKFLGALPPWPANGPADVRGTFLVGEVDRSIRGIAATFVQ